MANELVRDLGGFSGREEFTATVAGKTGDIVFTGSGKAAIVCDTADYAIGERVAVSTDALVLVDSASATTFAAGATVNWDATNKLAVASGTAGTTAMGKAEKAKVANELSVLVRLN
jgi:hypothetical protein